MTPQEVRQLTDEQIKGEIHATREKLFKLRSQAVTEKVENTGQFRVERKHLARLLTERTARRHKHYGTNTPAVAAKSEAKPVKKKVAAKPAKKTAPRSAAAPKKTSTKKPSAKTAKKS
jgi:ribosomal protein L29